MAEEAHKPKLEKFWKDGRAPLRCLRQRPKRPAMAWCGVNSLHFQMGVRRRHSPLFGDFPEGSGFPLQSFLRQKWFAIPLQSLTRAAFRAYANGRATALTVNHYLGTYANRRSGQH